MWTSYRMYALNYNYYCNFIFTIFLYSMYYLPKIRWRHWGLSCLLLVQDPTNSWVRSTFKHSLLFLWKSKRKVWFEWPGCEIWQKATQETSLKYNILQFYYLKEDSVPSCPFLRCTEKACTDIYILLMIEHKKENFWIFFVRNHLFPHL